MAMRGYPVRLIRRLHRGATGAGWRRRAIAPKRSRLQVAFRRRAIPGGTEFMAGGVLRVGKIASPKLKRRIKWLGVALGGGAAGSGAYHLFSKRKK